MKKMSVYFVLFWAACFAGADILDGQIRWCEDASTTTNTAIFFFDTALQSGRISGFWMDESGTVTDDGFLVDGIFDFTVSSVASTYDELTNFDVILWSIYEERILGVKVEEVSGSLGNDRFHVQHWDYLMGGSFTYTDGSFSAIPEPASVLLFGLGLSFVVVIKRMKIRAQSDVSLEK
jgi:hypothetical protein